jgi:4-hydroxyphenylpyruvate dioxygenase
VEGSQFYVEGQRARMSWSRNCRLFLCEEKRGGYLPVLECLKAICDEKEGLGYKGWVSMELFNRSLTEEGEDVPRKHAERAMDSWKKVVKGMGWDDMVNGVGSGGRQRTNVGGSETGSGEFSARL